MYRRSRPTFSVCSRCAQNLTSDQLASARIFGLPPVRRLATSPVWRERPTKSWSSLLQRKTLGINRSILVLRDAEDRRRARTPDKNQQSVKPDGEEEVDEQLLAEAGTPPDKQQIQMEDLERLLDDMKASRRTPGQDEVNKAIEKQRRRLKGGTVSARPITVTQEQFDEHADSLDRQFSQKQLANYVTIMEGSKVQQWQSRVVPTRNGETRTRGRGELTELEEQLDAEKRGAVWKAKGEWEPLTPSARMAPPRLTGKRAIVDVVLRNVWGLQISEVVESEGVLTVTMGVIQADILQLERPAFAPSQNTTLSTVASAVNLLGIAKHCAVRIVTEMPRNPGRQTPDHTSRRLLIYGSKAACERAASIMERVLLSMSQMKFEEEDMGMFRNTPGERLLFEGSGTDSRLSLLAKRHGCIFDRKKHMFIGRSPEDAAQAVRAVWNALYDQTRPAAPTIVEKRHLKIGASLDQAGGVQPEARSGTRDGFDQEEQATSSTTDLHSESELPSSSRPAGHTSQVKPPSKLEPPLAESCMELAPTTMAQASANVYSMPVINYPVLSDQTIAETAKQLEVPEDQLSETSEAAKEGLGGTDTTPKHGQDVDRENAMAEETSGQPSPIDTSATPLHEHLDSEKASAASAGKQPGPGNAAAEASHAKESPETESLPNWDEEPSVTYTVTTGKLDRKRTFTPAAPGLSQLLHHAMNDTTPQTSESVVINMIFKDFRQLPSKTVAEWHRMPQLRFEFMIDQTTKRAWLDSVSAVHGVHASIHLPGLATDLQVSRTITHKHLGLQREKSLRDFAQSIEATLAGHGKISLPPSFSIDLPACYMPSPSPSPKHDRKGDPARRTRRVEYLPTSIEIAQQVTAPHADGTELVLRSELGAAGTSTTETLSVVRAGATAHDGRVALRAASRLVEQLHATIGQRKSGRHRDMLYAAASAASSTPVQDEDVGGIESFEEVLGDLGELDAAEQAALDELGEEVVEPAGSGADGREGTLRRRKPS